MIYYCLVLMEKPLRNCFGEQKSALLRTRGVLLAWNMHTFWKKNLTVTQTTLEKNVFNMRLGVTENLTVLRSSHAFKYIKFWESYFYLNDNHISLDTVDFKPTCVTNHHQITFLLSGRIKIFA